MRFLIAVTLCLILLLSFALACRAQDTNVSVDIALSNLLAQAAVLKAQLVAAKAATTVQTVVFSNGVAVATNTAAAPLTAASIGTYSDLLMRLVETLGSIGAAILILARSLRKIVPDSLQTGVLGMALKHVSLEINPQLTPTPPGVASPNPVKLEDTKTGAVVEPVKTPTAP